MRHKYLAWTAGVLTFAMSVLSPLEVTAVKGNDNDHLNRPKAGIEDTVSGSHYTLRAGVPSAFAGEAYASVPSTERYIDEWYKEGKAISEIAGAREVIGGRTKLQFASIGFTGEDDFRKHYFGDEKFKKLVKDAIDVDFNEFDRYVNQMKDSDLFYVGAFGKGFMRLTTKKDGQLRFLVIPLKLLGYGLIKDYADNNSIKYK